MVKNGQCLIVHGTPDVSHKWFDKFSRLIEWFLHADSDGAIFCLAASLLCIFDIWMLGNHCNWTWLDFLRKIPFGQKQQNMQQNDH